MDMCLNNYFRKIQVDKCYIPLSFIEKNVFDFVNYIQHCFSSENPRNINETSIVFKVSFIVLAFQDGVFISELFGCVLCFLLLYTKHLNK